MNVLKTLMVVVRSVQTLLGPTNAAVTLDTDWMQIGILAMVGVLVSTSDVCYKQYTVSISVSELVILCTY